MFSSSKIHTFCIWGRLFIFLYYLSFSFDLHILRQISIDYQNINLESILFLESMLIGRIQIFILFSFQQHITAYTKKISFPCPILKHERYTTRNLKTSSNTDAYLQRNENFISFQNQMQRLSAAMEP